MKKSLQEHARKDIVSELSEGLADTDSEKFHALVEELSFEDVDTFKVKVQTIRENYFTVKPQSTVQSVVTDTPVEELTEETKYIDPSVAAYVKAFKQFV